MVVPKNETALGGNWYRDAATEAKNEESAARDARSREWLQRVSMTPSSLSLSAGYIWGLEAVIRILKNHLSLKLELK